MLQFFRVQKARRSVVAQIAPLIDATSMRMAGISDNAWRTPYMIGYISMLISLSVGEKTAGAVTSDNLGLAQLEIWQELTGLYGEDIGAQICALSAARHPLFREGCENAVRFFKARCGQTGMDDEMVRDYFENRSDLQPEVPQGAQSPNQFIGPGGGVLKALWIRYFDDRLTD